MKFLLDEMYPPALAAALRVGGLEVSTVAELGLAGRPDADVFSAAVEDGWVIVTENVSDFGRIAAEHIMAGRHHPGMVVALSSRFSRRPSGIPKLAAAIRALQDDDLNSLDDLDDRVIYLEGPAG